MDTQAAFKALNDQLQQRNAHRDLTICGGAALIALRIVARETRDVDVLKPNLDPELEAAANVVRAQLNLKEHWLNNDPASLMGDLPPDWESHCQEVFSGSHLTVRSLGRRDLIYSKVFAYADRMSDLPDIVKLQPTEQELADTKRWLLDRDASDVWPQIVEECLVQIRKRLGYG